MKKKTKKSRKPSYKQLEADLRKRTTMLGDASTDATKASRRADKYEKAYRDLKNNLGQYLAMFANDYGVDPERAKKLQEAMFSEPDGDSFTNVHIYAGDFGDFGNIAMVPSPQFK